MAHDDDRVTITRAQFDKFLVGIDAMGPKVDRVMAENSRLRRQEEAMSRELQFRADAQEQKDDRVLKALDTLSKRIDAIEAGLKKPRPEPDDDDDAFAEQPQSINRVGAPALEGDTDPEADAPKPPMPVPGEEGKPLPVAADSIKGDRDELARHRLLDFQSRAQKAADSLGVMIERPMHGESLLGYAVRTLRPFQKFSDTWRGIDLDRLNGETLRIAADSIMAAMIEEGKHPRFVPANRLRAIQQRLPSGHLETLFHGSPSAWMNTFAGRSRSYVKAINLKGANEPSH